MNKNFTVLELVVCILSLIVLGFGFFAPQTNLGLCFTGVILFVLLAVFHVYTPRIAHLSADNPKVKTMKRMNIFSMILLLICFAVFNWMPEITFMNKNEAAIKAIIVIAIVVVVGNIAPKLPFNRYMGLRLPWTVRDEATWKVAHRLLGYLTFPVAIIMIIGVLTGYTEKVIKVCVLGWILIPSLYSCYYYYLKIQGKR